MKNTKLIELLSSLSVWELKSFEKYVASPFFNVNENVAILLEVLIKYYPEFDSVKLPEQTIYKELFGKQRFNHQRLRYVMTDLTVLLENFLAFNVYFEKPFYQKKFLLHGLREKRLDKYFIQHLNDAKKSQLKTEQVDLKHYKRQLGYEELSYEFTLSGDNRSSDTNLQSLSDHLDIYYLTNKLKYCCEILNRQNVLQTEFKVPMMQYIVEYLEKYNFDNIPLITIYFKILKSLSDDKNDKHYKQLKALITKYQKAISINELRDIYVFVQNYCIRKINTGHNEYLRELFNTYKTMLENEIIFETGELQHLHFKNIVTLALRLDEIEWTEKFITQYSDYLNKELRKNAVSYNLARVHYARKHYREALRVMRTVEFTDMYYHLDAKALLLKIYYEMDDIEPLFSLITTMRVYLKRSKLISEYQRTIYINLINHVKTLARIKSGGNQSIEMIKQAIKNNNEVADINWLKTKIAELVN